MSNENEISLIFLEGCLQGYYKLLEETITYLKAQNTDSDKKEFLRKQKKEIQNVMSYQKLLLKDLLFEAPQIYKLIISKWDDLQKFIEDQINILDGDKSENETLGRNNYGIEWTAPDTHLIELIYALIETPETLRYKNREDVVKAFSQFFGFEMKGASQKLHNIKVRRNSDNRTIFLDRLKKHFQEYIDKEG